jgi:protein O-GlcNAc transferase
VISGDTFNEALDHHQQGRLAEAERLYRQVLARQPTHATALHHLGLIAQSAGRLQDACELLQQATSCNPADAVCHNNLANVLRQLNRVPEAVASYKTAVRYDPDYINAHFNLASLLMDIDDPQGAAGCYREVLRLAPEDAEAVGALGTAMMALGNTPDAIACFRRVISLRPDDPAPYYNLAMSLKDEDNLDAALTLYRQALGLNPDYAEAHNNVGLLLRAKGERKHAIDAFGEAIRSNPQHIHAYLNLASLLLEIGDYTGSEQVSRKAVEIDARNPSALQSLGAALAAVRNFDEAEHVLRTALEIDTELSDAHLTLGILLEAQNQVAEASMEYRAVAANSTSYRFAQNNLAVNLMYQGQLTSALDIYTRTLDAYPSYVECHSNMLLCSNYVADLTPSAIYALHRGWAQQHTYSLAGTAPETDLSPSRPLHIGYVSPDLCSHSVAYFIEPLITGRDRERYKVTCYADVFHEDKFTRRIRDSSDQWRDLRGLDDEKAAALIREDSIDILVDLAGHTARNRMQIFARRVAPIQVTYLGYPNTTGLEEMDYRLTDEIADPPGKADELHSEELVRLDGGFLCYAPPSDAPPVSDTPALADGHVTFGSFNNTSKVNESVVAVWAQILNSLPGSRLLLKSAQLADAATRRRLQRWFTEQGINEDRIELMGKLPNLNEHLGAYSRIDVGLDPFPYNGTTTTCEALWMGVPVVTLAGNVHRARVGASILHYAGLDELITPSIDAYIEKALGLARDPQGLTTLRRGLRQRVADSVLADVERAVDALQFAYREMWRRYRESAMARSPVDNGDEKAVRLNIGGTLN